MPRKTRNGQNSTGRSLAELCNEAVALHGSDWEAIEKYVADRLQDMSADDRSSVMRDIESMLNFEVPRRGQN